jgi:hypothetical protein
MYDTVSYWFAFHCSSVLVTCICVSNYLMFVGGVFVLTWKMNPISSHYLLAYLKVNGSVYDASWNKYTCSW